MVKLLWDQVGQRFYETGVDRGVLYPQDETGAYPLGVAWNGLTAVTESPSGAEPSAMYADNIKYLNLQSREDFNATIEAYTYPAEFEACDGTLEIAEGVMVGQQTRQRFGLAYRTRLGNDVLGDDFGYKLHLVYGALAAPTEKGFATVNDSKESVTFSWELSTVEVEVGEVAGTYYKPTALLTIVSNRVDAAALAALEDELYGTAATPPSLPLPAEVAALFA